MAVRDSNPLHWHGIDFGGKWSARAFGLIGGLVVWLWLASIFPEDLMPYPFEIADSIGLLLSEGVVWKHVSATLFRSFWGFVGATFLGIALGVIMGVNDFGEGFITPYVVIGLSIPGIVWAAITTVIFGFGSMAPILATIVTTFPYISLNVWKGVENIDHDLIEMSESFGLSRYRLLRRMILPSVAPALFTAFRFGIAISWKIETSAEIFASNTGVGWVALEAFRRFQYNRAWAWAAIFVLILLFIEFGVIRVIERKVYEYRPEADFGRVG